MTSSNKRPLLKEKKGDELLLFIRDGLTIREPFYSQAAFSVTGDVETTVSRICDFVENYKSIE